MKRVFLFLVVVFGLFATMTSYAADTMNWNQLQVGATYNKSTQELKVEFLHSGATYTPSNTYTSRLILTGFDRTQSLVFNPVKNVLQTQYVYITSPMKSIYQYIYSVTDTSTNKIVSSYSGSISFTGSTNSNILISITNFSNTPSTSTGTVVTQTGSIVTQTGSINASYNDQRDAQTIYSIVMADMQKKPYSTLGKIEHLTTVIASLQAYIVKYPSRKNALSLAISKFQAQINVYKGGSSTIRFIPKYKSRAEEPSIINGIGNSRNYTSWRVE